MEKRLPDRQSVWIDPLRSIRALGAALLLGVALVGTASAQQIAVTGTVTSTTGTPLAYFRGCRAADMGLRDVVERHGKAGQRA
jgi:hypothetical protein